MKLSKKGIDLIHSYEDCKLDSYLCPAGIPTIGWGNTYYESGRKVKMGESISQERADKLFEFIVNSFVTQVKALLKVELNDNQFSALVSFAYNLGITNLRGSTLLKKVNLNKNDLTIKDEFLKWVKAGGKVLKGLVKRRKSEGDLYFED